MGELPSIYRKQIRMTAKNDPDSGCVWELVVDPWWADARLYRRLEDGEVRQEEMGAYRKVVGYFVMRLVCRGLSLHEIVETETEVKIDCGVMPPEGWRG